MELTVVSTSKQAKSTVWQRSSWWAKLWNYLSIRAWGSMPAARQRAISARYAQVYDQPWSRLLIAPYCWWHYPEKNYLSQFKPPQGKAAFETFQDFFTREFIEPPTPQSPWAWPCEGTLCHIGQVGEIPASNVKGDIRSVEQIFGLESGELPQDYHFSNVFLHNKNYHRIHAPVDGTITRIQHIPDELVVLRPWIYKENPSVPAFRNERVNVDILDKEGRTWYLSIVGGPAVGTIELPAHLQEGSTIKMLDELAVFYLGSTCCMAAPVKSYVYEAFTEVEMGMPY
ncbi:MAG: phosphatidylserine decarboxylase [Bacteroidota bacterium]